MHYKNLLSPIQVGNLVLKNRLISGNSLPHFLQGPESYPAEPLINHVVNVAKNGAAVVTFADWCNMAQRNSPNEDGNRFPMFNLDGDKSVENYICQLADQVHYYHSHISIALMPFAAPDPNYDINEEPAMDMRLLLSPKFGERAYDNYNMGSLIRGGAPSKQMTKEMIQEIIEMQAQRARKYQLLGFDMATLHFAYRATLFARFLSPRTNHRTDEYGGSLENRARFLLELCSRIKELCGKDFPIEVQITPEETDGMTLEETCQLAKLCEGYVDIFQFRAETANLNHPTGYNSKAHWYAVLDACAAVKKTGTKVLCAPIGGFQNPEEMEEALREGKADLIAGARMFIADFEFYEKLKSDRGNEITPCIRCNKCHVPSLTGDWLSYCSVNPRMGIEHRLEKLTKPVSGPHKVAVIGGGPAGMRGALYAKERGYEVDLYEKTDALGGQLKVMDGASFKWPLVQYRQWLIGRIQEEQIPVHLNTVITPQELKEKGYDTILLALGAQPKVPPIPGAEKAYNVLTALTSQDKMGHRCVVIGGSESGTEVALYLAEHGHRVTVLTRGTTMASDATPIHYRETMDEFAQEQPDFDYVTEAVTTEVGDGYVCYRDKDGNEHRIDCDDVVALGGMEGLRAEAMGYYGITPETYMIGDCFQVGNLHTCNRMAYSAIYNL